MVVSLVFSWAIPTAAHNWIVINSSLAMVIVAIISMIVVNQILVFVPMIIFINFKAAGILLVYFLLELVV